MQIKACKLSEFKLPNSLSILLLFSFLFVPHVTLDFVFHMKLGDRLRFDNGQYYFYFCSFFIALLLYIKMRCDGIKNISPPLSTFGPLVLMTSGVVLSFSSMHELRLFSIVMSSVLFCWVVAVWVLNYWDRGACVLAILIVIPFSLGPIFSVVIEFIDLFIDDFYIQVPKHNWHNPPRWHFLDANANGFGFDAALSTLVFGAVALNKWPSKFSIIPLILAAICAFALYKSGTRAAFIFLFVSSVSMCLMNAGLKKTFAMVLLSFTVLLLFIYLLGIESIDHIIRFRGGIEAFSSGRIDGIQEMWALFLSSPLIGQGFGFSDSGRSNAPTNIFFLGLLSEIGIVGFVGAIWFASYPICLFLGSIRKNAINFSEEHTAFLVGLSVSVLIGFFVYLFFEFGVLRVSVYNQLFFLCWSITLLFIEKHCSH